MNEKNKIKKIYQMIRPSRQAVEQALEIAQMEKGKRRGIYKWQIAAAALFLAVCVPISAYAAMNISSKHFSFFEKMFGNREGKDSADGSEVDVMLAEQLIGENLMDTSITREIKGYTITIESFTYDENVALMCFTLKHKGGVDILQEVGSDGSGEYNFSVSSPFRLKLSSGEGENEIEGGGNIYVDRSASTEEEWHCYEYAIMDHSELGQSIVPKLNVIEYPYSLSEETYYKMSEQEWLSFNEKAESEIITLSDKNPIQSVSFVSAGGGRLNLTPVSAKLELSTKELKKKAGKVEGEQLAVYVSKMNIVYSDSSEYVVVDNEKDILNAEAVYSLMDGSSFTVAFHNLVNVNQVTEVSVNGVAYVKEK